MALWNPWRGCHKYSEGCRYCYIHKGDSKRGVDTNQIVRTDKFYAPIEKNKKGEYKIKSGQLIYICFSSDFLIEEADEWRKECWDMIKERSDLTFLFLTKRIDRFSQCMPEDWNEGYDNVTVGCTIENQHTADYRLSIFDKLPIKHKNIVCQPIIEKINLSEHLKGVELVVVGGESDKNARVFNLDWAISIRKQCINANVPFNFRQYGTNSIKDGTSFTVNVRQLCSRARNEGLDC